MEYSMVAAVEGYLAGVDLSALGDAGDQEAAIADAITGAVARVDAFTRRSFSTVTEAKIFNGSGTACLFIPDLVSFDSWSLDGASREASELVLYPAAGPRMWIRLLSGIFTPGWQNVQLAGTWGYAESVPAAVASATAKLAAADVLGRVAAAKDRGTSSTVQGALSERYDQGAYAAAITRLGLSAQRELVPYRRLVLP
jgi:hypothetical protein